jgi:EmrB/QacA subfamily drug resistance transporter
VKRWRALAALGAAQFVMVLDTAVMNVSISQLTKDFHTTVTAIQAVITLYALVMAALMITGGKLGDLWGRRRAFTIGLCVYAVGSSLTAVAPTLGLLALGWSIIEGTGAALVLPALAALVAGNYTGRDRAVAYGVIGGLSGAGIAVGPLLGGWVTTYLTWRLVFAGEVVVVIGILAVIRWITDVPVESRPAHLDGVGAVLSASGLALVVLGVLQSTSWGWLRPRNSPVTILGFALTPFVIAAGFVTLVGFRSWERRRERTGRDPLVRFELLRIPPLRAGLSTLLAQNVILLGLFFTIPLYLQVVQGLDAFETGLRLVPVSITMLIASMCGPALSRIASPRRVVRAGLLVVLVASLWLMSTIKPHIDDLSFAFAMALLGIGMGLLASQLGNVVQSSVGTRERSEVGGLQYTAQNLGSALGTALIGSVLIGALTVAVNIHVHEDPQVSSAVQQEVGKRLEAGISFVSTDQVRSGLEQSKVPPRQIDSIVDAYSEAQLEGLKTAILAAAGIAIASLLFTRNLPTERLVTDEPEPDWAVGDPGDGDERATLAGEPVTGPETATPQSRSP